MIPQVDIAVTLFDTGYQFRAPNGLGGVDLGAFGLVFPRQEPSGLGGYGSFWKQATFPRYNSEFHSPTSSTPANFALDPGASTEYAATGTGSLPAFDLWGFDEDGPGLLQITWDNGVPNVSAKITSWPGDVDYSGAGMVVLNITNPQPVSFGGIYPVVFTNGERGFVVWGVSLSTFDNVLLPIRANLATATAWVLDPLLHFQPTVTIPVGTVNYQADFSAPNDVTMLSLAFNVNVFPMTVTQTTLYTDGITAQAFAAFTPSLFGNFTIFYTPQFVLGVNWVTPAANTNFFYLSYDGSAFGEITFTMPDASLGPSGDPSVYWVWDFNNFGPIGGDQFWYYPSIDALGTWFWIRVPLTDGLGNMTIEPLTGEVYSSVLPAAGGKWFGTHVGFWGAGGFGGGTK